MADDLALQIPITAVTDGFKSAMQGVKDSASGAFGNIKSALTGVQEAMGAVGIATGGFLVSAVQSAAGAQSRFVDLQQTIKSTGGAAGYSAEQIKDMATSMAQSTTYSAGEVIKGQNMLLTFTNIQGQVFKDATSSMLDLSQKMGTAPQQTAIQLGKALNDPITGITALTRVGVTFTEQQKEQIKTMEDAGNMAGAQEVIIKELNKEFGGQAAAQLNTYSGQMKLLTNNLNSAKTAIGSALLPYLQKMTEEINKSLIPIIDFVKGHSQLVAAVLASTTAIGTLVGGMAVFSRVSSILGPAVEGIVGMVGGLSLPIAGVVAAIGGLALAYTKNFGGLKDFIDGVFGKISSALKAGMDVFNQYHSIFGALHATLSNLFSDDTATKIIKPLAEIRDAFTIFTSFIQGDFESVKELFGEGFGIDDEKAEKITSTLQGLRTGVINLVQNIGEAIKGSLPPIKEIVSNTFTTIVQIWNSVLKPALELLVIVIKSIVEWVVANWPLISETIKGVFEVIKSTWENVLKPVFALIIQIVGQLINWVIAHWPEISAVIGATFKAILEIWNNVLKPVLMFIIQTMGQIIEWVVQNWPLISQTISTIINAIVQTIKVAMAIILAVWTPAWNIFKNIIGPVFNLIKDIVTTAIKNIESVIALVMNLINGNWGAAWQNIKDIISNTFGGIKAVIGDILNIIIGIIKGWIETASQVWDAFKSFLEGLWNAVKDYAINTWNTLKNTVINLINGIVQGAIGIWNGLLNFFYNLPGTLYNAAVNMFNSMASGVSNTINNVYSAVVNGINSAINFITNLPGQALQWGKDFIQGLINGITGMIGSVEDAVSGVADKIRSFLHFSVPDEGSLTDYEQWMPDFMKGLADGISNSKNLVTDAIKGLSTDMSVGLNLDTSSLQTINKIQSSQLPETPNLSKTIVDAITTGMSKLGNTSANGLTLSIDKMTVSGYKDVKKFARDLYNINQDYANGRGNK